MAASSAGPWKLAGGALVCLVLVLVWTRTLRARVAQRTAQFQDEFARRKASEERLLTLFEHSPEAIVVMDFESADTVTELFNSDDYAALVPVRDRGFKEMNILLTHTM